MWIQSLQLVQWGEFLLLLHSTKHSKGKTGPWLVKATEQGKISQSCCSLAENVSFSEMTQLEQLWQALPCPYHAVPSHGMAVLCWEQGQFQCTAGESRRAQATLPREDQKQHVGFRAKSGLGMPWAQIYTMWRCSWMVPGNNKSHGSHCKVRHISSDNYQAHFSALDFLLRHKSSAGVSTISFPELEAQA